MLRFRFNLCSDISAFWIKNGIPIVGWNLLLNNIATPLELEFEEAHMNVHFMSFFHSLHHILEDWSDACVSWTMIICAFVALSARTMLVLSLKWFRPLMFIVAMEMFSISLVFGLLKEN